MVLARLLTDCGALSTEYGRVMIGITLVEDIAVVFMTIIIPIFSGPAKAVSRKPPGLSAKPPCCSSRSFFSP